MGEYMYSIDTKMLTLAINWNRIDVARSLLASRAAGPNAPQLVARALQHALALRRVEFVDMLLQLPRHVCGSNDVTVTAASSLSTCCSSCPGTCVAVTT